MNWFNFTDIIPPKLEFAGFLVIPRKHMKITKLSKTVIRSENGNITLESCQSGWMLTNQCGAGLYIDSVQIPEMIRLLQVAETESGITANDGLGSVMVKEG